MYFSPKREFIADTGGADLAGHQNMINAPPPIEARIEALEKRAMSGS